jgi:threonylcarbamoyladenosine tRNA methylthiotransferase MtaB
MKAFICETLGCKVNRYESEALSEKLVEKGWRFVEDGRTADLYIINTCTVTGKAAMQSRQAVRKAIRNHPEATTLVTGCYAQIAPQVLSTISGVKWVVGHSHKHRIPEIVESASLHSTGGILVDSISAPMPFQDLPLTTFGTRARAFVKIQDGCDAFCAYCIVPYSRGRNRSLPPERVLDRVRNFTNQGYHEVVLCGIHIGRYGQDLTPATSLSRLFRDLDVLDGVGRIRISSIEPMELTETIIQQMATSSRFCPHFHIPLQSGDDDVLKTMNRPYTTRVYRDLIHRVADAIPHVSIGVDVMAGFPGETQKAFENTYRLIEGLPIAYLHVFPFSLHRGLPAEKLGNRVSTETIKSRSEQLRRLGQQKRLRFYQRYIGTRQEILVEGKQDKESRYLKGITRNYIPVLLEADESMHRQIVSGTLERIERNGRVFGHLSS